MRLPIHQHTMLRILRQFTCEAPSARPTAHTADICILMTMRHAWNMQLSYLSCLTDSYHCKEHIGCHPTNMQEVRRSETEMWQKGLNEPSTSSWGGPLMIV